MLIQRLPILLLILLLAACTSIPKPEERRDHADQLAAVHGWRAQVIPAETFELIAYVPDRIKSADLLTVYIEGDGLAWIGSSRPSDDPTPRDPLALRLALAQPTGNAVYLARPCQFQKEIDHCRQLYWTNKRFAPEVVAATNTAISALKIRFDAQKLQLVGYSGGGAIAALVAARRDDVSMLVTVAGNLDTQEWVRLHRLSPLAGSLNPADASHELAQISQTHFSGENDRIVPPEIFESFASRFLPDERPPIKLVKGYDHVCCWVQDWAKLWDGIQ